MRKNYVLDANILIHDPQSIFQFADNTVIIPVGVLREIDRFKKEMTDRGYSARAVVRLLDGLRGERSLAQGVRLEKGGTIRVFCQPDQALAEHVGHADTEILRVARATAESEPDVPVVIVTKDLNLRIRADAAGLRAEDYESDHVSLSELNDASLERQLAPDALAAFLANGELSLNGSPAAPNQYALLRSENGAKSSALARIDVDGARLIALRDADTGVLGVRPRNKEQYFALDALLDERVQLVTLMGKAGTGKTLLAMAAGLYLALKRKGFRSVLVARPIIPLGRDMGYLPGDISQKIDPWMKPLVDTVEYLLHAGGPIKGQSDIDGLIRAGSIEIQPLTYIRGRSISHRFVVIDEAQNLTPLEVKTVITRIGQGAKVVLTGDPYQIDNPYVDATSNGFTYLVKRFRGQSIAAHVHLRKGERSPLAELAANLL
ncbi:MAG: PhoH family protein [Phycisphaerae bacterium]